MNKKKIILKILMALLVLVSSESELHVHCTYKLFPKRKERIISTEGTFE